MTNREVTMTEPVNHTILLLDIEQFGRRDDVEQAFMRRMLYSVLHETLRSAGIEPAEQRLEDRGDSVMALINPTVPKPKLLHALINETPTLLHANNRLAADSARVRLRIVLAAGEVAVQELGGALGGVVGWDLNQAFRLLDSTALREALKHRDGPCVLSVSDAVYQGIVRHGHGGLPTGAFHRITVQGKEGDFPAWLYGEPAPTPVAVPPAPQGIPIAAAAPSASPSAAPSAGPAPAPAAPSADPAPSPAAGPAPSRTPATFQFLGGSPSFGGNLIGGDQHVVSGGEVHGDVNTGNTVGGDR
jgi:class 3 adenylate cyclase